ncbi:hypothetical protein B0I31_105147 [Saccharothrix carnea]|uniref:Uncharacterized protein n=1 Tax=Saccharothrix carnea TaxID=1280637 RepID=A0A2P8I9N7_SACCR|nr:hypothetical protein [Saccharothrix carnea]PSL55189.1 hypothetical protein B0I31_105147 [Saccharothrix carnea]
MSEDDATGPVTQKPVSGLQVGVVISLVFLAGIACYVAAYLLFPLGFWHGFFHSAGEALVVAFLVAILGDLYLRFRSREEAVRRGVQEAIAEIFGFLGPSQPRPLQEAVKEFGKQAYYAHEVSWRLTFDWKDDSKRVVRVLLSEHHTAHNLDPYGLVPTGRAWVMESTFGEDSSFLAYRVECAQARIGDVDLRGQDLAPYVLPERHGKVELDLDRMWRERGKGRRIDYGMDYSVAVQTQVFRDSSSSLPLTLSMFAISLNVEFDGNALNDLSFSLFVPSQLVRQKGTKPDHWRFVGRNTGGRIHREWRSVTPWQAVIVSWWPSPPIEPEVPDPALENRSQ